MSHTYYEVKAVFEGETEVLYGSFNPSDARYELQAEKEGWKAEGYKLFGIQSRQVKDAPDPEVYPELY